MLDPAHVIDTRLSLDRHDCSISVGGRFRLLLQEVAGASRCRVVWSRQLGFATVIGFDGDRQAVDLLYMSLLVQVTTAVVRTGSRRTLLGRSRTRSFRQSFLSAFSVRIGQRLRAVAADTTRDMSVSGADALLPVLAARDVSVREKVDAHFPELEHRVVGMTDREGWGRAPQRPTRLSSTWAPDISAGIDMRGRLPPPSVHRVGAGTGEEASRA